MNTPTPQGQPQRFIAPSKAVRIESARGARELAIELDVPIEFRGIWEQIHNPAFIPLEFERYKKGAKKAAAARKDDEADSLNDVERTEGGDE